MAAADDTVQKQIKLAIIRAFKDSDMSQAEFARLMGIHHWEVKRLLDLDHTTKFERLLAAANVLGFELQIDLKKKDD